MVGPGCPLLPYRHYLVFSWRYAILDTMAHAFAIKTNFAPAHYRYLSRSAVMLLGEFIVCWKGRAHDSRYPSRRARAGRTGSRAR